MQANAGRPGATHNLTQLIAQHVQIRHVLYDCVASYLYCDTPSDVFGALGPSVRPPSFLVFPLFCRWPKRMRMATFQLHLAARPSARRVWSSVAPSNTNRRAWRGPRDSEVAVAAFRSSPNSMTRVAYVDGNDTPPNATVTHTVDLSQFSGRQKLLAIWSIGDTPNAFYNCVDLLLGGSQPSSTTSSTPSTTTTPPATTTPPSGTAKAWAPGTKYAVGDTVTYNGKTYQCLQAHTAYDPTLNPATTPALWKEI